MPKFLCQNRCYIDRLYERGRVYDFSEKPNHHFVALNERGEIAEDEGEFDPSTEPNFDADTYDALMAKKFTKKEIVDYAKEHYEKDISKVDQGLEKDNKKPALVKALIEARENYVPKPQ